MSTVLDVFTGLHTTLHTTKAHTMAWYQYLDRQISNLFYHYGKLIARHPRIFLVGSLILAAMCSLGVLFLTFESDAAYLFTPDESRAREEKLWMSERYPVDYDNYWMSRTLTTEEKMGNFMVVPQNGDNVLTDKIVDEVLQIDSDVRAIKVEVDLNHVVNFSTTCGRLYGQCLGNPLVQLLKIRKEMGGALPLTYPVTVLPDGTPIFVGSALGGVTLGEGGVILSAKALMFAYLLKSGPIEVNVPSMLWEEAFSHYSRAYESSNIVLTHMTSQSLSQELLAMTERVMPLFIVTFAILFTFSVTCCLMSDWVQSKPWLGQLGKC